MPPVGPIGVPPSWYGGEDGSDEKTIGGKATERIGEISSAIYNSANTKAIFNFFEDPLGWLASLLASWIIRILLGIASVLVWAVYTPFDIIADSLAVAGSAIIAGVSPAVEALQDGVSGMVLTALDAAGVSSTFAPLVTWVVLVIIVVLCVRLGRNVLAVLDPR